MDAAIILYTLLVTAVCLYLNIAGLRHGPGKMLLGFWKSLGIICTTKRVGTLSKEFFCFLWWCLRCISKKDHGIFSYNSSKNCQSFF